MFKPIVLATALALVPVIANAECGDRGGPGYRGPDGKCRSWADLGRVCGSPPTTNCTPERVHPDAKDGAALGNRIDQMKRNAHGDAFALTKPKE
jgi:hypothetical protein